MSLKIALLGAESTGKTTLCSELAALYHANWIPEYARDYVSQLNRDYTFEDIEHIANQQFNQINAEYSSKIVFFDTELIITKVWFEVVFHACPQWINEAIVKSPINYYLLCNTDIDWIPDAVRENGGEMRNQLHAQYETILKELNLPYAIVSGAGQERIACAVRYIDKISGIGK